MSGTGVHHVRVPTPPDELEKMRSFYGHLGFQEVPGPVGWPEDGAWFEGEDGLVLLAETGDFSPLREQPIMAVEVDDAEATRQDLNSRRRNVNDATPVRGGRRFYAFDPAGNKLEFVELG
jgi:catechol 2,3-dioxygenase-like lactoylglutathione lyase family enzyme